MAGKSVFLSVISLERFVIDGYRGTRTHVVDVGDEAARLQYGGGGPIEALWWRLGSALRHVSYMQRDGAEDALSRNK